MALSDGIREFVLWTNVAPKIMTHPSILLSQWNAVQSVAI